MGFDIDKIEEKIDRAATASIELSDEGSGIAIKRLVDAMEIAKLMSISKQAVPKFMQGEPGICYAAVVRAVRWGMDPFFVAEQSYLVRNPKTGEEKIAFMAQLMVAVINARAPLARKLRPTYEGEGEAMVCTVHGVPKGEAEALEYTTPTLGELIRQRGRNESGNVKGSPLWTNDPKQQLWYYAARAFCRRHFPEVLAGVYDIDEFEPAEPRDVTPPPSLKERLKGQKRIAHSRGFDAEHIARETKGDEPKGELPPSCDPAAVVDPASHGSGLVEAAPAPDAPAGAVLASENTG